MEILGTTSITKPFFKRDGCIYKSESVIGNFIICLNLNTLKYEAIDKMEKVDINVTVDDILAINKEN